MAENLPGVELPKGRQWAYFLFMAASAAMFGGVVYHVVSKLDPLGYLTGAKP